MTLPFFHKTSVKQKKGSLDSTLKLLYKKEQDGVLQPEEMDENFFYKHLTTQFRSLFSESNYVCIPHSKSIQGLLLTKDIIEAHCFQRSPYFRGQLTCTRQKEKCVSLDYPVITTVSGYKEKRTVHILAEETVYLGKYRIRVCLIDRLLEGEAPKKYYHKPTITIPPIRNSKSDLEFLNMFPENLEALSELQINVQDFIGSFVYIKGYNTCTVERIQHMCIKTYNTILQKNKLIQDACRIPSGHDHFQELVENVVMSFLHKKIWIQTLRPLLRSQDDYLDSISHAYSHVILSQYSLRYPLSEMHVSCFHDAISNFQKIETQASTPLEKAAVLKSTLDLISSAVHDSVQQFGHSTSDTSVTSDEMIPLLAFIIVQSGVRRKASLIYYMQHYRLARTIEGSVYNFVLTTMKSACEFLKDDPLSLYDNMTANQRSLPHRPHSAPLLHYHQKTTDFRNLMDSSAMCRPYLLPPNILLPHSPKDFDLMSDWKTYSSNSSISSSHSTTYRQSLGSSEPMISTTFPSLSNSTPLYQTPNRKHERSLSSTLATAKKRYPPEIIHVPERTRRPASITIDTRSSLDDQGKDDLMGDFLKGLSTLDDDVARGSAESIKTFHHIPSW
ncbi:hypothetical protein G6F64_011493 [Rhizopus arrhizus]|uniref:VPS9 domain-containing protein n=1 Tax=Rhizopus oryzae TaxID=64495 RepID=A0A9P7BME6_RHIOR|nr:hypothetical protein G6F23_009428 [Rhizopus arrhizus]KAG1301784.1 hypothetical protein G6F64_011493 [Rhizopus arrhizus]KAG1405858.1 hypothetical protein G6F58_009938 [Rhizopus delemar]